MKKLIRTKIKMGIGETPAVIGDLKSQMLFKGVRLPILEQLLPYCAKFTLSRGQPLTFEEEEADFVYLIIRGYVVGRIPSDILKSRVNFMSWRGPGQVIGEIEFLEKDPGSIEVEATKKTEFLKVSIKALKKAAQQSPLIYRNLSILLTDKLLQEQSRAETILLKGEEQRVAAVLLSLEKERGCDEHQQINGNIRHKDLADYICGSRPSVTNILNYFKDNGLIYFHDKRDKEIPAEDKMQSKIKILKKSELKEIAKSLKPSRPRPPKSQQPKPRE